MRGSSQSGRLWRALARRQSAGVCVWQRGVKLCDSHLASFLRAVRRKSLISLICFGCESDEKNRGGRRRQATCDGAGQAGNGGATETLLQVAKQQAQRDEELMGARIQAVELQAQIVEARELHRALRERCAETERRLKRSETTGGLTGG